MTASTIKLSLSTLQQQKWLERCGAVTLLNAAIETNEVRFARQLALAWLAAFPGDLGVALLHARALMRGGSTLQALPLLAPLAEKDPWNLEVWQTLVQASLGNGEERYSHAVTCVHALGGRVASSAPRDAWGDAFRAARLAYETGAWDTALKWIETVMEAPGGRLFAALLRLQIERKRSEPNALRALALEVHARWPECIMARMILADVTLLLGDETEGVRLLHTCAAADPAGQIARRVWGSANPYQSLWPEDLGIPFDLPIPAGVAGKMGWNQLESGPLPPVPAPEPAGAEDAPVDQPAPDEDGAVREQKMLLQSVTKEFEQISEQIHQPGPSRVDGRCPVYVIVSSREGLRAQYGPQTASVLDMEMRRLAGLVRNRYGWKAVVYYPDDAACTGLYGATPVNPRDPWKIKHSLAELDEAMAKRGERIGALLITGGDRVVPYHRLPNPTDDADGEIASDAPYGTLDANYFVPEWPVGRLPGDSSTDAGPLLESLRVAQRYHARRSKGAMTLGFAWWYWFQSLFERFLPSHSAPSFGYSAAVWRRSSLAVFRPIGAPHTVLTSPPVCTREFPNNQLSTASLGYYNLHGLEDSPAWYGQRDPQEAGPDYPVALAPEDLQSSGHAPHFVFSEACYGGHIHGKTERDSLALKFLGMGALGVVASTCIAYGSVATPLIAADLLGYLFWHHMKSGRPAGEALMQARLELVREMTRRQGYLDGEDQKTLISFVLYGDPLAAYDEFRVRTKSPVRPKSFATVKALASEPQDAIAPTAVSAEALAQVKRVVAEYLPGADLTGLNFCKVRLDGKPAPVNAKHTRGASGERMVVTVRKEVKVVEKIHNHYLRVTLDEAGRTVKLAMSR